MLFVMYTFPVGLLLNRIAHKLEPVLIELPLMMPDPLLIPIWPFISSNVFPVNTKDSINLIELDAASEAVNPPCIKRLPDTVQLLACRRTLQSLTILPETAAFEAAIPG
ncbi:hypothetical protein D3C73_1135250 [compost metagenome]